MEELGAGYYPWGRKESGMTEQLHFLSLSNYGGGKEDEKDFCFIDYAKAFDCVDHNKLWKI